MAYEKQTWNTGDVITAQKLNHMEDGIAEGLKGDKGDKGDGYVTAGATDKTKVGQFATAEGAPSAKEVGFGAHAEGATMQVLGQFSHGEGFGKVNNASATGAHAEGNGTASEPNSHAEGDGTTASGTNSHAEGYYTTASGANSHASGYSTIATADSQFVCGKYNERDDNAIFIVGIGNGSDERENIFSVGMYNGVKKLNFGDVSLTEDQLENAPGMSEADVDAKLDNLHARFLKSGDLNNIKEPGIYYFSWEEAKNIDNIPTGISDFQGTMFELDVTRVLAGDTLVVNQNLYCLGNFQKATRKWTRNTSIDKPETFFGWTDVSCPLNVNDTLVRVTSNLLIDNGYLKIGSTTLTEAQLKKLLALITS